MPIPSTRILFQRLSKRRMNAELASLFQPAIDSLTRLIISQGDIDGHIDPRQQNTITARAGQIIMGLFVGLDGRNAYAPDGITPLSPFAAWMNREIASVQADVVIAHARYMNRALPSELRTWLRTAQVAVSEQRQHLTYIPTHEWMDKRGFTMSDRVWQTGERTRTKIDALLRDGIRQGQGSRELARDLERFLQPGRSMIRTIKPYGKDASFDAMRLARTEISFAHAQASYKSAAENPFVDGIDVALSNRHPLVRTSPDECDELATMDWRNKRLRDPYTFGNVELPPYHPHCCLPGQAVITDTGAIPIEEVTDGDKVLTHEGRYRRVSAAWSKPYSGKVYTIKAATQEISVTSEHPILTQRGWVNAEHLQVGDKVLNAKMVALILEIIEWEYDGPVYNMSVKEDNSYTLNGIAVHNCLCNVQPALITSREDVVNQLRAQWRGDESALQATPAPLTPAAPRMFMLEMLGSLLMAYVSVDRQQELQQLEFEEDEVSL